MSKLFKKKPVEPPKLTPEQFTQQVKQDVQEQTKLLNKLAMQIDSEVAFIQMTMKTAAKSNSKKILQIYARNVVSAQKQKSKILENIACLSQFESQVRQMCVNAQVGQIMKGASNVVSQFLAENSSAEMVNAVKGLIKNSDKLNVYGEMQNDVLEDMNDEVEDEDIEKLINEQISRALGSQQYGSYQKLQNDQKQQINIK